VSSPKVLEWDYTDGLCFGKMHFKADFGSDPANFDQVTIEVTTSEMKGWFCEEYLFFASMSHYHLETFGKEGTHTLEFKNLSADDKVDIAANGIRTFLWCDGIIDTAISLIKTIMMFAGGLSADPKLPIIGSHIPDYMAEANIDFLYRTMGGPEKMGLEKREKNLLAIDPDTIGSGDFFVIMRLDGLDPLIDYGTGSHSGHSVMSLRFDGELYMVESQDGWYWPNKHIQRTKWADWV
jgi:hypothetical protein